MEKPRRPKAPRKGPEGATVKSHLPVKRIAKGVAEAVTEQIADSAPVRNPQNQTGNRPTLRMGPRYSGSHTIADGLLVPYPGSHVPARSHTVSDGLLVRPPGSPEAEMDSDDDD